MLKIPKIVRENKNIRNYKENEKNGFYIYTLGKV